MRRLAVSSCRSGPRLRVFWCRVSSGGELPVRPHEMAGVALRVPLKIVLMLALGLPEFACGNDLGHDLAWPQARRIDIGNRVFGNSPLFVACVENRRSIAGAEVASLPVFRGR